MSSGRSDHRGPRIVRQILYDCKVPCGESYFPMSITQPNAHFMNLASRPIGAMHRKQTFTGIVLLSLALARAVHR
jgi:hypothetical protein